MKLSLAPLVVFLGVIILPPNGRGAIYSTGFSRPLYTDALQLAGQDGWVINDPTDRISFFVDYNRSLAGAIGGYFDAPASTHVDLTHPYGGTLDGAQFSTELALIRSTEQHPGFDSFGYSFRDTANNTLLRVAFEPNGGLTDSLEIVWYDAANTRTSTNFDLFYGAPYDMSVSFGASGANGLFSLVIGNALGSMQLALNTVIPGAGSAILASFGVDFDVDGAVGTDAGDNFMVFEDLSMVGPSARLPITLNISFNPSKQPVISFQGVPGTAYQLQRSTTALARSWAPRETITAPPSGTVRFVDPAAPSSQAFYRVVAALPVVGQ